ncbi:MAG: TetR/AcrR family transcriptional regulator, partial [Acidimicrobiales bacterium]
AHGLMAVTTPVDQRGRILDAALALMAQQGSAGASMRQLAGACGLNVATLYHYFPSKADLLRSVVEERRYGERLALDAPPLDPSVAPRARLVALLDWLWANALEEQAVWRLLVGEAVHGEGAAADAAREVVDLLAITLEAWLDEGFADVPGDHAALARIIRGQVFSLVVEHLALGEVTPAAAHQRAEELATALLP